MNSTQLQDTPSTALALRRAGHLLILAGLATLVAVAGRVAAEADQETLAESLAAIADSRIAYGVGGAGRLISGIGLALGAWFLMGTWIVRESLGSRLVPGLFVVSGAFTGFSGLAAITLAAAAPAGGAESPGAIMETVTFVRWAAGAAGFAEAGLAFIIAAVYQWRLGGNVRLIAPALAVLGVAMQFIWIDAVAGLHRATGVGFVLWLFIFGALLSTGRAERILRRNPEAL